MNAALVKISALFGSVLFIAAMVIGLARGVQPITALYRALMIMMLGSVAITLFFQFFARVLYDFIETQQRLREQEEAQKREAEKLAKQQQRAERSR